MWAIHEKGNKSIVIERRKLNQVTKSHKRTLKHLLTSYVVVPGDTDATEVHI